jgi:hypothetical protein
MTKWSLKELCLKAVVDQRRFFSRASISSAYHKVQNLRKDMVLDFENFDEISLFLALALQSDLISIVSTEMWNDVDINNDKHGQVFDSSAFNEWCKILSCLLHHHVASIRLPRLYHLRSKDSLEKLIDTIGNRCQRLRMLNAHMIQLEMTDDEDGIVWLMCVFYRALSRLANLQVLQLRAFPLHDMHLQLIAANTPNLVYDISWWYFMRYIADLKVLKLLI